MKAGEQQRNSYNLNQNSEGFFFNIPDFLVSYDKNQVENNLKGSLMNNSGSVYCMLFYLWDDQLVYKSSLSIREHHPVLETRIDLPFSRNESDRVGDISLS